MMKVIILLILIPAFAVGQSKITLDFDSHFKKVDEDVKLGIYEFDLSVPQKSRSDIDYFSFVINVDGEKTFEDNGVFENVTSEILTFNDL